MSNAQKNVGNKSNISSDEWDKNLKVIQDYMDTVTKLNNLKVKDNAKNKHSNEIKLQEENVEKLKEKALEARATLSSMVDPHNMSDDTFKAWIDMMDKFNQATKGSAESLAKLKDVSDNIDSSKVKSMKDEFESFQKKVDNLSLKPDSTHRFPEYQKQLDNLNSAIRQYGDLIKSLENKGIIDNKDREQIEKARDDIEKLFQEVKKFSAGEKGYEDISATKIAEQINKLLKDGTALSKQAKAQLKAYYAEASSGHPSRPLKEIYNDALKVVQAEREMGREGKSFISVLKDKAWYGLAGQMATMFGFYDIVNGIRQCVTTVRELDTALTEMRKVSDEGLNSLKRYQDLSFDVADEIGSTALALQNATATWMRLGETLSEASESAKDATVLMNVSEFESINEATDSLVSMSQAFKELDKMEIIDVLDKIGNEYSISTDNLSRALQDSAAVLKTQGNDLYESVALITAGNAINQDYSKTSGGVRTISLRLSGTEDAKEKLSSLGEDVDDFIVQTNSKTQKTIKDYTAVASNAYKGVDVLDASGNLRNTYNILLDISKIYKEIQEEDKKSGTNRAQALVEYIAGKNRSNIASSILLNPELLESVYESAKNADGAAMKELNSYMESLDAKVAQFQNRLQQLEADLIDSDFLKGIVDTGTNFIHFLDTIIDKFGTIIPLATAFGAALGIKNVGRDKMFSLSILNMPTIICVL